MRRSTGRVGLSCFLVLVLGISGCSAIKQAGESLLQLRHLEFKLGGVSQGRLAGVDLAKASEPSRLSAVDGLKLAAAFAEGAWPLSINVDLDVKNPNDGAGENTALLSSLAWTLQIDGKNTISGDIPDAVSVPGAGNVVTLPLRMQVDLFEFFGNRGYDEVLNLALAVAGAEGSASRLTLLAVPTVSIGGVPVRYPGTVTIVDTEFSGS